VVWMSSVFFLKTTRVDGTSFRYLSCGSSDLATLGKLLGTNRFPSSLWHAISWFHAFLPEGRHVYMVGLAVVCWSIRAMRNKVTFDMRSPMESVFTMCSFLLYWAGLQTGDIKE
jgi:hypothetical protein